MAAIVGASLATGASPALSGETEQAVLAAQDRRLAATLAADVATLGSMMTDDLTYTHSSAVVETKAQFLDALKTGKYRYKSTTFEERGVRLHGDAAIVSGTCRVLVVASGKDVDIRLRFTELYVKEGGTWKMALWQSTKVPEPAP
jgi:ketosteroid isomerase-like protein